MLRGGVSKEAAQIPSRWKDAEYLANMSETERAQWECVRDQYMRKTDYRRAFICNKCYHKLDNMYGEAEIFTPAGPKTFGINASSRGGNAAVYNFSKYQRFQDRTYQRFSE